jgi:hypothetical protein
MIDFEEHFIMIDGKRAQVATYAAQSDPAIYVTFLSFKSRDEKHSWGLRTRSHGAGDQQTVDKIFKSIRIADGY